MGLKGSKTEQNLKDAFAGESQANRRYLYFATKADIEGQNDVAALFRSTAEGETGHAHGHLEFLEVVGDPATVLPIGATRDNLKAAVVDPNDSRRQSRSADTPSDRLAVGRLLRRGQVPAGSRAHLRHLPRLPALRKPVPDLPDAVRPGRRHR